MDLISQLCIPRVILQGTGALQRLGQLVQRLGYARPLLLTDSFLVSSGAADAAQKALLDVGLEAPVFADTVPEPTVAAVEAALCALRAHDHDCVVALGGGSPIDTAKAAAFLALHPGSLHKYKAPQRFDTPGLPVIAVPTTAGSGSEVTQFAVVTDDSGEKMLCTGLGFLPVAAVVDPTLTHSKPWRLSADTGLDALTHAIEAYVSKRAGPMSSLFALDALKTISASLLRVCENPGDAEARSGMARAAMHAGLAFSNASVGLVHGMSRPLGVHFHIAHGLSNAQLLAAVTKFSLSADHARYAHVARAVGASGAEEDQGAAEALVPWLASLTTALRVPSLVECGVSRPALAALAPTMASQALASGSPANNPRVPSAREIEQLYMDIFDGKAI